MLLTCLCSNSCYRNYALHWVLNHMIYDLQMYNGKAQASIGRILWNAMRSKTRQYLSHIKPTTLHKQDLKYPTENKKKKENEMNEKMAGFFFKKNTVSEAKHSIFCHLICETATLISHFPFILYWFLLKSWLCSQLFPGRTGVTSLGDQLWVSEPLFSPPPPPWNL